MPILILLAFILVPIAEIAVFIKAGEMIGLGWTLAVIILTAVIGTALLRQQGLKVLSQTQEKLNRGEMPVGELFTGLCLLVAGALLLTPGFITDTLGLTLLFRPTRLIWGQILVRLQRARRRRPQGGPFGGQGGGAGGGEREPGPRRTVIIEGDYVDRGSERQDAGGAESAEPPQVRSPPDDRPKDRGGI